MKKKNAMNYFVKLGDEFDEDLTRFGTVEKHTGHGCEFKWVTLMEYE